MYDQSKLSELIRFARVGAGSTVIDVYPGDGDWTRLFSDVVGPEGRVYSFVPAEIAHVKNDSVGRMRTLAKEPGRENVKVVSADLVAMPEAIGLWSSDSESSALQWDQLSQAWKRCRFVFLWSDDEDAIAPVAALAKQLGFAPVKLGKLNEGGALLHARGRTWGQLIFQDLFKKEQ
jgi:hypothetical protein